MSGFNIPPSLQKPGASSPASSGGGQEGAGQPVAARAQPAFGAPAFSFSARDQPAASSFTAAAHPAAKSSLLPKRTNSSGEWKPRTPWKQVQHKNLSKSFYPTPAEGPRAGQAATGAKPIGVAASSRKMLISALGAGAGAGAESRATEAKPRPFTASALNKLNQLEDIIGRRMETDVKAEGGDATDEAAGGPRKKTAPGGFSFRPAQPTRIPASRLASTALLTAAKRRLSNSESAQSARPKAVKFVDLDAPSMEEAPVKAEVWVASKDAMHGFSPDDSYAWRTPANGNRSMTSSTMAAAGRGRGRAQRGGWKRGASGGPTEGDAQQLFVNEADIRKQLHSLVGTQCRSSEEKYQLLKRRDDLLGRIRGKNIDLTTNVVRGTCVDMCPEKERYMRQVRNNLNAYECDVQGRMTAERTVKDYSRSAADQDEPLPHELRSTSVLDFTVSYLFTNIANEKPVSNQALAAWYDFLWSRTRAVRKDITQQMLCDKATVEIVEKCVRLHVFVSYRLAHLEPGEFDQRMNNENLSKSLQTLRHMYEDLAKEGVFCDNEAEFRSYEIILNLADPYVHKQVDSYRDEIRRSKDVQLALGLAEQLQGNNYVRFFRTLRHHAPFLQACLCRSHFSEARRSALKTIALAYLGFPLAHFAGLLGFNGFDDALGFLRHFGVQLVDADATAINLRDGRTIFARGSTIPSIDSVPFARCGWLEAKAGTMTLSQILCKGGPVGSVPPRACVDSFDSEGRYVNDPVLRGYLEDSVRAPPAPAPTSTPKVIAEPKRTASPQPLPLPGPAPKPFVMPVEPQRIAPNFAPKPFAMPVEPQKAPVPTLPKTTTTLLPRKVPEDVQKPPVYVPPPTPVSSIPLPQAPPSFVQTSYGTPFGRPVQQPIHSVPTPTPQRFPHPVPTPQQPFYSVPTPQRSLYAPQPSFHPPPRPQQPPPQQQPFQPRLTPRAGNAFSYVNFVPAVDSPTMPPSTMTVKPVQQAPELPPEQWFSSFSPVASPQQPLAPGEEKRRDGVTGKANPAHLSERADAVEADAQEERLTRLLDALREKLHNAWLRQFTDRWREVVRRRRAVRSIVLPNGAAGVSITGGRRISYTPHQQRVTPEQAELRMLAKRVQAERRQHLVRVCWDKWRQHVERKRQKHFIDDFFVRQTTRGGFGGDLVSKRHSAGGYFTFAADGSAGPDAEATHRRD